MKAIMKIPLKIIFIYVTVKRNKILGGLIVNKLLVCGFGLIVVGTFTFSTYVGGSGEAIAKNDDDKVPANIEQINYMSKEDIQEFKEEVAQYPKNQILTDEMNSKLYYIENHTEHNEAPKPNKDILKDPQVSAAVDYLVNIKDKDYQFKIMSVFPFGELSLYNTYPKGEYPQELLDKSYEMYNPILNRLKVLSQSKELNAIIDQTQFKMREAYLNDDPEMYLEAWDTLDVLHQEAGDRIKAAP
ncbi:hypothetical protein ABE288_04700 [Bacillus salipaludis]|uniref:hypothetical protein n=1 Tax=Bacillus salipaludis TaxID=2547811 RepID=UPI003D1E06DF